MATIEEAVNARLLAVSAVTALVGAAAAARIYPLVIPQDADRPALAYQKTDSQKVYSHGGFSALARSRFQFVCQAETYTAAKALADAVKAAFHGFKGTVSGVNLQGAIVESDGDGDIEILSNEVLPYVRIDIGIWHSE